MIDRTALGGGLTELAKATYRAYGKNLVALSGTVYGDIPLSYRRTKQPRLMVSTHVVHNLVSDYGNRTCCSNYDPQALRRALLALPVVEPGYVDFQAAGRVVIAHGCTKMTGGCNRWVDWMLHRLRVTKVPRKRR